MRKDCSHCFTSGYVLDYWLDRFFNQHNVKIEDLPPSFFRQLPLEFLYLCHCVPLFFHPARRNKKKCSDCEGTTWKLSMVGYDEFGEGFRLFDLSPQTIVDLRCAYVERCSCVKDKQPPSRKEKSFSDLLDVIKINLPSVRLDLGFNMVKV